MEVSHNEHIDSHAVVGGKKARSFGISSKAEFINMLSEGLYTHKKLAVVREVLCNSWDAHVISKATDVPVKITTINDTLVFRDFGTGIADEMMDMIYCVYGESTKTHNGEENGGFGLGSKAPFAYTPHFTVTSFFKGMKTVYAVSRGSIETEGRPDLREMVSVPTTEHGLEVSIPVNSAYEMEEFRKLVKQLTLFGEMNVELDGVLLDTLPFSKSDTGFLLINANNPEYTGYPFNSHMYVRYGTVIYPVPDNEEYQLKLESITKLYRNSIARNILIFNAKPNTIAPTPSRESLSMTLKTKETLKKHVFEISDLFSGNSLLAYRSLVKDYTSGFVKSNNSIGLRNMLLNEDFSDDAVFMKDFFQKPSDKVTDLIKLSMLTSKAFKTKHSNCYIEPDKRNKVMTTALKKYDPDNMDMYDKIAEIRSDTTIRRDNKNFAVTQLWNLRSIDLIKKAIDVEYVDYLRLYDKTHYMVKYHTIPTTITEFGYKTNTPLTENIYQTDIIIIGHSQTAIEEARFDNRNRYNNLFVFNLPRKKDFSKKLVDSLKKAGFTVIDVTHVVANTRTSPVISRGAGYLKLSETVSSAGNYRGGLLSEPNKLRITEPKEVFYQNKESYSYKLDGVIGDINDILLFVPDAVVVSSYSVMTNVIEKYSAKSGIQVLFAKIFELVDKDDRVIRQLASTLSGSSTVNKLTEISKYDAKTRKILSTVIETDPLVLAAARILVNYKNSNSVFREIRNNISKIFQRAILFLENDPVKKKLDKNPYLSVINFDCIINAIKNKDRQTKEYLLMLHLAIEG